MSMKKLRPESAPVLRTLNSGSNALVPSSGAARRGYIKDPGLDPVVAAQRDRVKKNLEMASQKRSVSGISGGVLHAQLELAILQKEIMQLEDGVEEDQNHINLFEAEKHHIRKNQVEDREWCETFKRVIGPFEEKYDACQADVVRMHAKGMAVYQKSFQKLIDEFGYHPAFKRWFDQF